MGQGTAMTVYDQDNALLAPLCTEQVRKQVEACLLGCDLTFERLITDLGALLTANPLIAEKAKPSGLYNCLITAARYQTTFGDGGMWVIPDKDNVRPQESEKHITQVSHDAGWPMIDVIFIHKSDGQVTVTRGDAGEILGFRVTNDDITANKPLVEMLGAFGVAHNVSRETFIKWFDRTDLDSRRDHSAAIQSQSGSPAWKNDAKAMHARSVRAAMGRLLVPIRTKVPGLVGSLAVPAGLVVDAQYEEVEEAPQSQTDSVTKELEARALPPPGPPPPETSPNEPSETIPMAAPGLFPALPVDLEQAAKVSSAPLAAAIEEFQEAWGALPMNPKGLFTLYLKRGAIWAKGADQKSVRMLGELKAIVFGAAKDAGFPQEQT